MSEVRFCHFDKLFDNGCDRALVKIFTSLNPGDFDNCVQVCHAWRRFIVTHILQNSNLKRQLLAEKLPYEWFHGNPHVWVLPISQSLAPPLNIYADKREIIMTTIDSMLVWGRRSKSFKGEFGPELMGSQHVMIKAMSFNSQIAITLHKHTNVALVWSRRSYRVIQEIPCHGPDGNDINPLFVKATEHLVVIWLDDGAIVLYGIFKDGTLRRRQVLNGHIKGNCDADLQEPFLLTASMDSKVNMWNLDTGKLLWSNSRSEARFRTARMSGCRVVAGGSYDHDGYLRLYHRRNGDVLNDMVALEGSEVSRVEMTPDRIVAQVALRHRLFTSKIIVMTAETGDVIAERNFVDVLNLNIVHNKALVVLNNQMGDFRTRISVFDLTKNSSTFDGGERVVYQYQHNYSKLPFFMDNRSVIHTSEPKSDLYVREFDHFFSQFTSSTGSRNSIGILDQVDTSGLCFRLKKVVFKKMCSKWCSPMYTY